MILLLSLGAGVALVAAPEIKMNDYGRTLDMATLESLLAEERA